MRTSPSNREPRAAWLISWIVCIWVYFWPWIVFHGAVRIIDGILWTTFSLLATILLGLAVQSSHKRQP